MDYIVYETPPELPKHDLRRIGGNALPDANAESTEIPADLLEALAATGSSPPFVPPRQSRATRHIALRGRGSQRGAIVARFAGVDRVVVFESQLELHCLYVLLLDRNVIDVWDQAEPIAFIGVDGKPSEHTLDYLVTYADGRTIGYAVKPFRQCYDELGNPKEFLFELSRVRTAARHPIHLVTEKDFSLVQVQDARTVHRWMREPDAEADAIVRELLPSLVGDFPIRTVKDLCGLEGRAFGAVCRAYRDGLVVKAEPKRLAIDTKVRTVSHAH